MSRSQVGKLLWRPIGLKCCSGNYHARRQGLIVYHNFSRLIALYAKGGLCRVFGDLHGD